MKAVIYLLLPLLAALPFPLLAQDPLTVGPDIYRKVLENERIRLLEVTFEPGARIGSHSHPDHAAYVIEGGKLDITGADGKQESYDLEPGQAVWMPAQTHSAVNTGNTRVKLLVVELKPEPGMMEKAKRIMEPKRQSR